MVCIGLFLILLATCNLPIKSVSSLTQGGTGTGAGGAGSPGTGGGTAGETTVQTPQTISWQPDSSGNTQFFTNDSSYLQSSDFSVWTWSSSTEEPMTTVEADATKLGGDPSMGFGITFCVQDENDFLVLYIDINGYYSVGKVQSGNYTVILPWSDANASSTVLYEGYGYQNDIRVTYTGSSRSYQIAFNGTNVTSFTDSTWSGGAYGFVTGISSTENFPDYPVDVRFRQIQPAQ